jgi:hypothetical protein
VQAPGVCFAFPLSDTQCLVCQRWWLSGETLDELGKFLKFLNDSKELYSRSKVHCQTTQFDRNF